MLSKLNKSKKGFTIIEVLIVLAIAGLILLIVFLAVPALQRNGRNTQRKNDVAALLAAVSEFGNTNNGLMPNGAWTSTNGTISVVGAAGTNPTEAKVGYYNSGIGAANGQINKLAAGTVTATAVLNTNSEDWVNIATGTECDPTAAAPNASRVGPTRSVTAVYEVETGSGVYGQQCQAS